MRTLSGGGDEMNEEGEVRGAHLSKATKGGAASVILVPTETKGGPAPSARTGFPFLLISYGEPRGIRRHTPRMRPAVPRQRHEFGEARNGMNPCAPLRHS